MIGGGNAVQRTRVHDLPLRTAVDDLPLAHPHAKVNVVAASTTNSSVRVLLLKYRELVAEGLHLLIDLLFLLLGCIGREDVLAIRICGLLLHVPHAPSRVQVL